MKKKLLLLFLLLSVLFPLAADELCWKGKTLSSWQQRKNVKVSFSGSLLKVEFTADDAQITGPAVRIDPAKVNCFSITYRAKGVKNDYGEMYFAHDPENFSSRKYWKIPKLNSDWQWHTVVIESNALFNKHNWFEGGIICGLRLDPVNKAGGIMEISEIKFFKK